MDNLSSCKIPANTHELGWKPIPPRDWGAAGEFVLSMARRTSPTRRVELPNFEIARRPFPLEDLLGSPYDLDVSSLGELCDLVDSELLPFGWRLPTEDELEAAAGDQLFPWGNEIPDGLPYDRETFFGAHKQPNKYGLSFLANPYRMELSRTALKFGDGGCSICGYDPWPIAWLALSIPFRMVDSDIDGVFSETLEECYVRPVFAEGR